MRCILLLHLEGGQVIRFHRGRARSVMPVHAKNDNFEALDLEASDIGWYLRESDQQAVIFEQVLLSGESAFPMWNAPTHSQSNPKLSTLDLWRNAHRNMQKTRMGGTDMEGVRDSFDEYLQKLEDAPAIERALMAVGQSLNMMNYCMGEICSHFHNRLLLAIDEKVKIGSKSSHVADSSLDVLVHSYALNFGGLRDNLAKFIATQLSLDTQDIDTLPKLLSVMSTTHIKGCQPLSLLSSSGLIVEKGKQYHQAGWLKDASDLRNDLVHGRQYGRSSGENWGMLTETNVELGSIKWERQLLLRGGRSVSLSRFTSCIYRYCQELFRSVVESSGYNTEIPILHPRDVKNFRRVP